MEDEREDLWRALNKLDHRDTVRRSLCRYDKDHYCYLVDFLDRQYAVIPADRRIAPTERGRFNIDSAGEDTRDPAVGMFILIYLLNARDKPFSGTLVGPAGVAGGSFFFRGIHAIPEDKLAEAFGDCPEAIYARSKNFDCEPCDMGDASVRLSMLPRIPLTLVIWTGDEEFPARAQVLFDSTAGLHMPLDALGGAVSHTIDRLVEAC